MIFWPGDSEVSLGSTQSPPHELSSNWNSPSAKWHLLGLFWIVVGHNFRIWDEEGMGTHGIDTRNLEKGAKEKREWYNSKWLHCCWQCYVCSWCFYWLWPDLTVEFYYFWHVGRFMTSALSSAVGESSGKTLAGFLGNFGWWFCATRWTVRAQSKLPRLCRARNSCDVHDTSTRSCDFLWPKTLKMVETTRQRQMETEIQMAVEVYWSLLPVLPLSIMS